MCNGDSQRVYLQLIQHQFDRRQGLLCNSLLLQFHFGGKILKNIFVCQNHFENSCFKDRDILAWLQLLVATAWSANGFQSTEFTLNRKLRRLELSWEIHYNFRILMFILGFFWLQNFEKLIVCRFCHFRKRRCFPCTESRVSKPALGRALIAYVVVR